MAIVDYAYYADTYNGEPIAAAIFPRYESRAEELINAVTRGADIETLPVAFQTLYKKAICAQVEYYAFNGISAATEGTAGTVGASYTLGKISVSSGNSKSASESASATLLTLAPAAQMYLEQTGLLNRNVATITDLGGRWFI